MISLEAGLISLEIALISLETGLISLETVMTKLAAMEHRSQFLQQNFKNHTFLDNLQVCQ